MGVLPNEIRLGLEKKKLQIAIAHYFEISRLFLSGFQVFNFSNFFFYFATSKAAL